VFAPRKIGGHDVRAASEAVDLDVGVRFARSDRSDTRAQTRTGGDLIPEETDPWDPAPRALAPEEPEAAMRANSGEAAAKAAVSSADERSVSARHALWVGFHSGRTSLLHLSYVGFLAESGNV